QASGDAPADRPGVLDDPVALLAVDAGYLPQHRRESRPSEVVLLRREIRAAVEHLALWREERGERPAALARECLDRALVARVHVGSLVAVHLDAYEVRIEELRHPGILVRLAVHDVAPVAPHRPDVEQDGFV